MEKTWLPLMEYVIKHKVSLLTLRRYIKSGRVEYKLENGRYSILDHAAPGQSLEKKIRSLEEEIAELKTLIALYEEQIPPRLDL
jgi:predicted site-specific integrase-resolvase